MRYFIHLAYKGTKYHGWQIQPNAITIQEILQVLEIVTNQIILHVTTNLQEETQILRQEIMILILQEEIQILR